jgi:hypothetical protein
MRQDITGFYMVHARKYAVRYMVDNNCERDT